MHCVDGKPLLPFSLLALCCFEETSSYDCRYSSGHIQVLDTSPYILHTIHTQVTHCTYPNPYHIFPNILPTILSWNTPLIHIIYTCPNTTQLIIYPHHKETTHHKHIHTHPQLCITIPIPFMYILLHSLHIIFPQHTQYTPITHIIHP